MRLLLIWQQRWLKFPRPSLTSPGSTSGGAFCAAFYATPSASAYNPLSCVEYAMSIPPNPPGAARSVCTATLFREGEGDNPQDHPENIDCVIGKPSTNTDPNPRKALCRQIPISSKPQSAKRNNNGHLLLRGSNKFHQNRSRGTLNSRIKY